MAVYYNQPVPVPTPYQPSSLGGNPFVTPGVLGVSVSQNAIPTATGINGQQYFNNSQFNPSGGISPTPVTNTLSNSVSGGSGGSAGGGTIPTGGGGGGNGGNVPSGPSAEELAQQAYLSSLNTQYDYLKAQGEQQIPYLSGQRDTAVSSINDAYGQAQKQGEASRLSAQQNNQYQTNTALSTAQDVQKQNRNVLRSLGILDSTAAGEALQKPMNEFAKQKFELGQALTTRITEIDNFLQQKATEAAAAVKSIQDNYSQLIGNIQNDLRFNDRQRANAINSANAAFQQHLQDIATQTQAQQASLTNYKTALEAQQAQIAAVQDPMANTGLITNTQLSAPSVLGSQTANIYDQRKKQTAYGTPLSQYAGMASTLGQPNLLAGAYQQYQ